MQITRLIAPAAMCLVWALQLCGAPASLADETTTVERTYISPGVYAPVSSTTSTVRTTTVENAPPLSDQVIERRTVILPESTGGTVRSSTSTTVDANSLQEGKPDYARRIHNLKSQLDKAISNGWISGFEANSLNNQYMSLLSQEESVRGNGYLKVDCDSIEKNLNAFNIQLSDDMAKSNHM